MTVKRKIVINRDKAKKPGRPRKYKDDQEKRAVYNQRYPRRRLKPGEYLQVLFNRLNKYPD